MYMLDTDISSYLMRASPPALRDRFLYHRSRGDEICVSAITRAELMFGVLKKDSPVLRANVEAFLALVGVVDFDATAADEAARIKHALAQAGTPIGILDILIAACASAAGAVIVTNNTAHFARIPGLTIENWCADAATGAAGAA